jgi:HAD superfamily hydrolase (TIGR01509 family)
MKRCVIFDMDGVIIDSEPIHITCEKKIFQILEISITDKEHHSLIGTTDSAMWTHLKNKFKLKKSVNELVNLKQALYFEYIKNKANLRPIPYIPELIGFLNMKGFLLALASSSPHAHIDFIMNEFNLRNYFSVVVSGDDTKNGKPNPEIFLKVSELAGVAPQCCVVIEDSNNGVLAAKNAKMKCIGYKNPNSGNQDLSNADFVTDVLNKHTVEIVENLVNMDLSQTN